MNTQTIQTATFAHGTYDIDLQAVGVYGVFFCGLVGRVQIASVKDIDMAKSVVEAHGWGF